jgi:hypothetical protein
VYTAVCTDAIMVKTRVARVASRPVYAAIGVTLTGDKDVLGLRAGQGAKFWMSVLTDLKNRGIRDVLFVVCDGLKGLPEVAATPGRRRSRRPAPYITPTCRLCRSGGGSCWWQARSSREGRHKPVAVTHAVLSGRGTSRDPAASRPALIPG